MSSPTGLPYPEQKLDDGSRICGEGGTIRFFKSGQVSVQISGSFFDAQAEKLISHFKADPRLLVELGALQPPYGAWGSQFLDAIMQIEDEGEFERTLDALVSTLKATRQLYLAKFGTPQSKQFIKAIGLLARKHQRPPTKRELAKYLREKDPARISKLCESHGFTWLPNGRPGRPRKSLH